MNFDDSAEEAAYRATVRAWLAANAGDHVAMRPGAPAPSSRAFVAGARAWTALKAAAGYSCIHLASAWGGGGGSQIERAIFAQEEVEAGVDYGQVMTVAHSMATPTMLAAGSRAMQDRFIPAAVRGDHVWCQLFSEPSNGSDLAAARTRATRHGDGWLINGQKIWTSGAHYSDYGLLLARTNPDVPKHRGLTMFVIVMNDPAVEVRPIHQANGQSEFNEVFFSDLVVGDDMRLSEVDKGWEAALVTLMNERTLGGRPIGPDYKDLIRVAREIQTPRGAALSDKTVRAHIAECYVAFEGLRRTSLRGMTALSRGEVPGPENSIGKLVGASQTQSMCSMGLDMEGQFGIISDPALSPGGGVLQDFFLRAAANRIEAGTDEIMRNIIAERVPGLPGDVRLDKDVAFKDLQTG
jgi:alkylation response protein AidB-like acyl-CoA dehydrogenase